MVNTAKGATYIFAAYVHELQIS